MKRFFSLAVVLGLMISLTTSCVDEESELGMSLADTTMLYNGKTDTLYADNAWTEFEDSLLTSNYSYGIIGNYTDPTFGKVSSELYTQIALPSNADNISLDSSLVIDSVILTLTKSQLFPDTGRVYNFHFEVKQLAEPLLSDTQFYAENTLPVNESAVFFDNNVSVSNSDTAIHLVLNSNIYPVLQQTATAEEFIKITKGLRIRITTTGDEGMVSIDFSSSRTNLRVSYHYQ